MSISADPGLNPHLRRSKAFWLALKNEYQQTNISQRNLAKKHGIAYGTLDKRARAEGWFQAGKLVTKKASEMEATITKKAQAIVADQLAPFIEKKKAEITKLGYSTAARGLRRVNRIYSIRKPAEAKSEADAARAIESLVRTARTSLGMDNSGVSTGPLSIQVMSNLAVQVTAEPNETKPVSVIELESQS